MLRVVWCTVVSLTGNQSRLTNFHDRRIHCSRSQYSNRYYCMADIMQQPSSGSMFSSAARRTRADRSKNHSTPFPGRSVRPSSIAVVFAKRLLPFITRRPTGRSRNHGNLFGTVLYAPTSRGAALLGTRILADSVRDGDSEATSNLTCCTSVRLAAGRSNYILYLITTLGTVRGIDDVMAVCVYSDIPLCVC
jgi:hypothetical protein